MARRNKKEGPRAGRAPGLSKAFIRLRTRIYRAFGQQQLIRITELLLFAWNSVLAFSFLFVLIRYKLEVGSYFATYDDLVDPNVLKSFLSEKWNTLILSVVFLVAYFFITKDSAKWKEQARRCFSVTNVPSKWKAVYGRWIIAWVVLTNILIFVAAALYTDNIKVFAFLFMIHHANAVAWLIAFRWNVKYYFYTAKYMPDPTDPFSRFILERRRVMEHFLCHTTNIEREGLTAIAYAGAFGLTWANQLWALTFDALPYLVILAAEMTNQWFSYKERRERNRGLRRISRGEDKISSKDRRRDE